MRAKVILVIVSCLPVSVFGAAGRRAIAPASTISPALPGGALPMPSPPANLRSLQTLLKPFAGQGVVAEWDPNAAVEIAQVTARLFDAGVAVKAIEKLGNPEQPSIYADTYRLTVNEGSFVAKVVGGALGGGKEARGNMSSDLFTLTHRPPRGMARYLGAIRFRGVDDGPAVVMMEFIDGEHIIEAVKNGILTPRRARDLAARRLKSLRNNGWGVWDNNSSNWLIDVRKKLRLIDPAAFIKPKPEFKDTIDHAEKQLLVKIAEVQPVKAP